MRLRAMAKINLGLDVLGKRPDGYHEVRMIMQTIRMYDLLEIKRISGTGITLKTNLPYIPTDGRNLVCQAAALLLKEFGISEGLFIRLEKFIPVAAGMGGGSADAAAAMLGVNRLFHLGLSRRELMTRAVQIGADVPYCILQGTALAEGIGEKLTRLPRAPFFYVLIGKPDINISTKIAYENLRLDSLSHHPDIDQMTEAIRRQDLHTLTSLMENVFEPGIIQKYPVIQEIKDLMKKHGALQALMSGSGPTVFGIFDNEKKLREAARALRFSRLAKTVFATHV